MDIPVYLFTGFLDSGKTKFIQETLEDKRFNAGEKTLLLVCEEGEEEYDISSYPGKNVYLEIIGDENDFTTDRLNDMVSKHRPERIVIEYNGMWTIQKLYETIPHNWVIAQNMTFGDSSTYLTYNSNMRNLVYDKVSAAELVIFNRVDEKTDKMSLHKLVRAISRRTDIAYEHKDGSVEYDDMVDPLPFDINADVIMVSDNDYALLYRDLVEDSKKYDGKTVKFKGIVARDEKLNANTFIVGRHVMTCCVEDIKYVGLVAVTEGNCNLKLGDWVVVTAKVSVEKHKLYGGKGPVLHVNALSMTTAPEQKVVTF